MKNKLRFVWPRLMAITVIAGLATLIIGTIFKLLLCATVLLGIGSFAASRMRTRDRRTFKNQDAKMYPQAFAGSRGKNSAIVPLHKGQRIKNATIVPVY